MLHYDFGSFIMLLRLFTVHLYFFLILLLLFKNKTFEN